MYTLPKYSIFIEYGLEEENLSKEEMCDLLKALKNSKSSEKIEEVARDGGTANVS